MYKKACAGCFFSPSFFSFYKNTKSVKTRTVVKFRNTPDKGQISKNGKGKDQNMKIAITEYKAHALHDR